MLIFFCKRIFFVSDYILTLDLGTTNIKAGIYSSKLDEVVVSHIPVQYITSDDIVEFDANDYWNSCRKVIRSITVGSGINPKYIVDISLTGQAESLVIIDRKNRPLRNGISWMDSRSVKECELLKREFNNREGYRVTGQPDIIPTWPITKILWLRENEDDVFRRVGKYLLLKDYIIYRLTGKLFGERTIYNFSYYFDVLNKKYWEEILDFVGVKTEQLPELIEPGSSAGRVIKRVSSELGLQESVTVNAGALDHFSGMVGSGNVQEGLVSETTGTVLAVATMIHNPKVSDEYMIPRHYGVLKDTYILMPVCESGGISLEWFKNNFYEDESFEDMNREIAGSIHEANDVIFLPYLTGTNSPEYEINATGVFYGLNITHTKADLARAIMEGVAYLLKKNIIFLKNMDVKTSDLISIGGGSKSDVWNQIKADITGKKIMVPEYEEPISLGTAILAAVEKGYFKSIEEAVKKKVKMKRVYTPDVKEYYREGYKRFTDIYKQLIPVFRGEHV